MKLIFMVKQNGKQNNERVGVKLAFQSVKKGLFVVLGTIFVGIGILGIFLPLLPTTVFLLIAAFFYARSSEKFYLWLHHNKWFGAYLKNYREKKGISLKGKIFTILILWITILYSGIFMVSNIYIRLGLLLIALGVTTHLLTIPVFRDEKSMENTE